MNTTTRKHRVHVKPRLSWRPITSMRRRARTGSYGSTRSGTRWFLFGVVPALTLWDDSRVARIASYVRARLAPCADCTKAGGQCGDCWSASQW